MLGFESEVCYEHVCVRIAVSYFCAVTKRGICVPRICAKPDERIGYFNCCDTIGKVV